MQEPNPTAPPINNAMAAIRSTNTKPELWVRKALHRLGFRFRLHNKKLPGSPDLSLRKYRAAIFVNGCFWHQHEHCGAARIPKSRDEFWRTKFARNQARDQKNLHHLKIMGWRTAVIWECGLKAGAREATINRLASWLKHGGEYIELPIYGEHDEI